MGSRVAKKTKRCSPKESSEKNRQEDTMVTSITHFPVEIQTSPQVVPSVPSWFGEVAIMAAFLKKEGVLQAITPRDTQRDESKQTMRKLTT
jgi:hypothetical protein